MILRKPSRLDRQIAKFERALAKAREKRQKERREWDRWAKIRAEVYDRDKGHCRACGVWCKWLSRYPHDIGQAHHIVYRSAGGSDELSNLVLLCAFCHDLEHQHVLEVKGSGNERISITKRDPETGKILREWEG